MQLSIYKTPYQYVFILHKKAYKSTLVLSKKIFILMPANTIYQMDDRTKNAFNTFIQFMQEEEKMPKGYLQGWDFPWKSHEYLIYSEINDIFEVD